MAKTENVESKKTKKEKKAKEPKTTNFPVKAFVNKWGFIHLDKDIISAFGVNKGEKTSITIDIQGDSLIIQKT
jgi:hypothetical protein